MTKLKSVFLVVLFMLSIGKSFCQDLEPRLYANLPKKMNVAVLYYGHMSGNVVADPSLPIQDFHIKSHNIAAAYLRTFGLAQKLARIQITMPYVMMDGNLKINGQDTTGTRNGFGDMRIRFGINLLGSPAMEKKDFRKYEQKTILGFSIVASIPTGHYFIDKRINIGTNRWAIKPELGISKRFKRIYAEGYMGVWFYANNSQYMTNKLLQQEPVYTFQAHTSYYFKNQIWVGVNANWFNGGRTLVDGISAGDLKDNWRFGATVSAPLSKSQSLKFQINAGAFTNAGLNYDVFSLSYQYIFF